MTTREILTHLLQLLAGVGTFMVACELLSSNLQAISSNKLKSLFSKVSNNKIVGVCIGALTTMLIQSSGATIVMVIGFVNADIISLNQAATIILGSEIGTTLTGQIVALGLGGESTISLNVIFAAFIGIGAFMDLVAKNDKTKKIDGIMIGFGMIFVGLQMMSSSMDAFAQSESLKVFLAGIDSVVVLVIAGAIITAVIQSSSAMTSIAITMIASGLISLEQGIYITLGANVGTCITGAIASMNSQTNAKRTSVFQLIFNGGGVVLVLVLDFIIKLLSSGNYSFSVMFMNMFADAPQTQLAMFHTIFNIATVLIALPISQYMADLCCSIVVEKEEKVSAQKRMHFFDEHMMSSPSIAVGQVKNEIINMAQIAIDNFNISLDIISKLNFDKKEEFIQNEEELDYLNENLVVIVAKLSKKVINSKDSDYLSSTYRVISDLERIGDYAENIVEYADHLKANKQKFSKNALVEIEAVRDTINKLYRLTIDCYTKYDEAKFNLAMELEELVDDLTEKMADNHIKRMNNDECNADVGAQYLQLSSDVERIADHLININDKDKIISH